MKEKELLRKEYINIRKNIKNKLDKSNIIYNKIITLPEYLNRDKVLLYSSLKDEVSTLKLIRTALLNKKVYLPRVINDKDMEFYKINNIEELKYKNKFGILEPDINNDKLLDYDLENLLVIIPGVCFDLNKNRVGFGKGYYDNYLSKLKDVYKIGICFDEQILKDDIIDIDERDKKVDIIVTDKKLYK